MAEKSCSEIKSIADEAFGDKSLMKMVIYMIKKVEAVGNADDQHYLNPKKSKPALDIIPAAPPPPPGQQNGSPSSWDEQKQVRMGNCTGFVAAIDCHFMMMLDTVMMMDMTVRSCKKLSKSGLRRPSLSPLWQKHTSVTPCNCCLSSARARG